MRIDDIIIRSLARGAKHKVLQVRAPPSVPSAPSSATFLALSLYG